MSGRLKATKVDKNCKACGALITVRLADHKRGWGNYCDKACAAAYKCGQRPKDVNERHAKYSQWASVCLQTGGKNSEKAPSIKQQLGHSVRVKHKRRATPHDLYLDDYDQGWDAHKSY